MNKIMMIECCCSKPKVEDEYKADLTVKKEESTKDIVNDNASTKEEAKVAKPPVMKKSYINNKVTVEKTLLVRQNEVNINKNYVTLDKGMIINIQEEGKMNG